MPADSHPLWAPSDDDIARAAVTGLANDAERVHGRNLATYADIHAWSVERPEEFWPAVWRASSLPGDPGERVVTGGDVEHARFFPDGRINVAHALLDAAPDPAIALVEAGEDGLRRSLTRSELREEVLRAAGALRACGVGAGDRVVAWTPNRVEVVILALAALRIGAVVSTASPDFAPAAVVDRFAQLEPVLLLGCAQYTYRGRRFDVGERLDQIVSGLPTVSTVVTLDDAPLGVSWRAWLAGASADAGPPTEWPTDHPGFVLFSSGTTGRPKCIVHGAAGVLLKVHSEQVYNVGLRADDVLLYYTTTGWMMWNWALLALGTGCTVVLYDGHPMHPEPDRLFEVAAELNVTVLGVSAKLLDSLRAHGVRPLERHDTSSLRLLLSTGSPLGAPAFRYAYEAVIGPAVQLMSISGGTDICGTFLSGVPTLPVRPGEIQVASLGMAVDIVDEDGVPVPIGSTGDLVCTAPFPSVPLGLRGDDGTDTLHRTYFAQNPGMWTHGDFAMRTPSGGYLVLGRSDATLNARGVRIGTAEIYRVVDAVPGVVESLAVAQDWEGDSRVVLFVSLADGLVLDAIGEAAIRARLRDDASPRHVPDVIRQAPELPRTRSNKVVELTVADILNGRPVRNIDALENPDCLGWFAEEAVRLAGIGIDHPQDPTTGE